MRNPFEDFLRFFDRSTVLGRGPIYLFDLLLVASIALAVYSWYRDESQRTPKHAFLWLSRLFLGGMWFQQTLWKLPPTFTDNPDGVSGGLRFWMGEMAKFAAFEPHRLLVQDVMLPNFKFFAAQVWTIETFIAISLMLGIFTPVAGLLGAAMAANLWLGLYNHPAEWPWTYFFLILVMGLMTATRAGRALGLDALVSTRLKTRAPILRFAAAILT